MRQQEKGFTLLETVISIAIFTMVMLVFMMLINTSLNLQRRSQNITREHNKSEAVLEGTVVDGGITLVPQISSLENIKIQFSGVEVFSTDGNYYTYNTVDNKSKYKYFIPTP